MITGTDKKKQSGALLRHPAPEIEIRMNAFSSHKDFLPQKRWDFGRFLSVN